MGHARHARRRAADARADRRRALARRLRGRRRRALVAPRRARATGRSDSTARSTSGLGTAHGLVGNVQALRPLLDSGRAGVNWSGTRTRCSSARRSSRTGWRTGPYIERPELASAAGEIRLQWCAGAPGIVVAAADYLDEELLLAGAELVWQRRAADSARRAPASATAPPVTATRCSPLSNAPATRSGSTGRGASPPTHSARSSGATGRYSLWTGDVGVAIFAADCLEARTRYPLLG